MSRLRTGPIYSQDVLNHLKMVANIQPSNNHEEDEAIFKEKMHALQRFLHHGMARFSLDTLKHILDDLLAACNKDIKMPSQLRSVSDLRDAVKATVTKREAGSLKSSDATTVIYMEHFFFAIYCLTEGKKIFDEIYSDMKFSYYTEQDVSRQVTGVQSSQAQGTGEDYSQFGISTLEQMTGTTQHKLRLTVKDVNEVLTRWSNLLTDEEPEMEHFDPESEQDLLLVQRSTRMEPLLRLLPDIFAKYYKCLELLKQWWVLAHEIYPELPFQRRPPSTDVPPAERTELTKDSLDENDLDTQSLSDETTINIELLEAKKAVKESTEVLKGLEEELEALEKREEKFEILKETYDKVGEDIDAKHSEQKELWAERERLRHHNKGNELQEVVEKLRRLENELRLLEFQHALLSQDYMIHMEIRPSIIRFHGDVALRVQDARMILDKRLETLETVITEKSHIMENSSVKHDMSNNKNNVPTRKASINSESLVDEVFEGSDTTDQVQENDTNEQTQTQPPPSKRSNKRQMPPSSMVNLKNGKEPVETVGKTLGKTVSLKTEQVPATKAGSNKEIGKKLSSPQKVASNAKNDTVIKSSRAREPAAQVKKTTSLKENTESGQEREKRNHVPDSKVEPDRRTSVMAKQRKESFSNKHIKEGIPASPIPKLGQKTITSSPPSSTMLKNKTNHPEKQGAVKK